jgi:outer membrane protein insertion porin family
MRVSPKLLALLATSGLLGLVATPAQANPTTALESSPEPSSRAADADYDLNASSLAAPSPTHAQGDSEPTDILDFGRLQPDFSPSSVAETLQGAIDSYRVPQGDRSADSADQVQPESLDSIELGQIPEVSSELGNSIEFSQTPEAQRQLPDSVELSQTPSTQQEISPEEAQRILDGAVQRRNQQSADPDEAGQVDGDEDVDEAPDESAEEAPDEPVEEAEEEPRVLVAEVDVQASQGELDPELENLVYSVVETQAGRTTTRTQLQQDINSIFATGFFADVDASPEDTDLGVRVTFVVAPNPVLTDVQVEGNEVLPQTVVDEIFAEQTGEIINLIDFQEGILELNQWYQDRGYVLAQVVAAPQVSPEGVVTLEVAEGVIENIEVRYINELGESVDEEGNPVQGRTRPFIVTREFETQPGDVFNQAEIEQDFQRVFGLGIFEDVVPGLEPAPDDPRRVTLVVNIRERNTGSVAAGLGFNFTGDLFGTVSFRQDNFGGNNQKFLPLRPKSVPEIFCLISPLLTPGLPVTPFAPPTPLRPLRDWPTTSTLRVAPPRSICPMVTRCVSVV